MKRCVILLAAAFVLSLSMSAQKKVTVEAANDEISDNLDLKAIGIIFGKAKNLEEFEEMRGRLSACVGIIGRQDTYHCHTSSFGTRHLSGRGNPYCHQEKEQTCRTDYRRPVYIRS